MKFTINFKIVCFKKNTQLKHIFKIIIIIKNGRLNNTKNDLQLLRKYDIRFLDHITLPVVTIDLIDKIMIYCNHKK